MKKTLLSLCICSGFLLPSVGFATKTHNDTDNNTHNNTHNKNTSTPSTSTQTANPTATATANPTATSTANGGNATGGSATTGPVSNTNNNAATVLGSGNSDIKNTNTLTNGSNTANNKAEGGTGVGIGLGGSSSSLSAGGTGGSSSSTASSNSNSASNASNGNMVSTTRNLVITSHVTSVAPNFTPSASVSMSGSGCGPLQSVVKTAVTGVFLGLLSNDNVALGTDEELAPYTENGVVKYFHELKNGTNTMLIGHNPMLSAAVLTTSGARQFSLGGNAVSGAGGSGAAGQSSGMQQQTMKIKLASCVFDIQDSALKVVAPVVVKEVGLNSLQKAEVLSLISTPQLAMTPRMIEYMAAEQIVHSCGVKNTDSVKKARYLCK